MAWVALSLIPEQENAMRERIVAGNWKLHGDRALARTAGRRRPAAAPTGVHVAILPPCPTSAELAQHVRGPGPWLRRAGLDANKQGAYTGEVSGRMLRRHRLSLRAGRPLRAPRSTTRDAARAWPPSFAAAKRAGLVPILCVGETLQQREAGQTEWAMGAPARRRCSAAAGAEAFAKRRAGLRAGLGDRHRPDRHAGAGPGRSMPSCVAKCGARMLILRARCRSSMAAASSPPTPPSCFRSRMWMAA